MRPFSFEAVNSTAGAVQAAGRFSTDVSDSTRVQYLAGGTTLIDLMKLDVMRPAYVVDINALHELDLGRIDVGAKGLRLGALVRMAEAAEHADIVRNFPAVAQSLQLAASQQIRNMASLGGNVLQRTRCPYFRDPSWQACNKRSPGSGCAALAGFNRIHAILGTSDHCIATHPSDMAVAMRALDANVETVDRQGDTKTIPIAEFHRLPGDTPEIETTLKPGEIITAVTLPPPPPGVQVYRKVRDRASYAFALVSVAAVVDSTRGRISSARLAFGGLAHRPWRSAQAEQGLANAPANTATFNTAANAVLEGARGFGGNDFKIPLTRRTLHSVLAEMTRA